MTPPAKRKQDYQRAWAARPLPHMQLLGPGRGHWILKVDGRVRDQWSESARPGYAELLALMLASYHGAWHSAHSVALPHVERGRHGGIIGMERRWFNKQRYRALLEAQIEAARARGEDPHDHVADWAVAYPYSKRHIRRIIDEA